MRKNFNLDFLDNKIQEEQQRQQQQARGSSSARRAPSSAGVRRGSTRGGVNQRAGGRPRDEKDGNAEPATTGPDPDDFVIGDDASDISRVATPAVAKDADEAAGDAKVTPEKEEGADDEKGKAKTESNALPEEVQQKLARLESLTKRYQGMVASKPLHRDWHLLFYSQNSTCVDLLRNYRIAHANVASTLR